MRVLLDSGIFIHSEFAEGAIKQTLVRWGSNKQVLPVHGIIKKASNKDHEFQAQKEALFTIGRLIREGRLEAYSYNEIRFEMMRGRIGMPMCYALQNCTINRCFPPLERSKFRMTTDFNDAISKGGKKDRKASVELGSANQITFFAWLRSLKKEHVDALVRHAERLRLTGFEVESLRNIYWFQFLCERSGSPENYPDIFHLWTAERNGFDAVLTLEKRLPNLVSGVRKEKVKRIEIKTEVLRPLDLLEKLGIDRADPVPMDANRFYHWHEVTW